MKRGRMYTQYFCMQCRTEILERDHHLHHDICEKCRKTGSERHFEVDMTEYALPNGWTATLETGHKRVAMRKGDKVVRATFEDVRTLATSFRGSTGPVAILWQAVEKILPDPQGPTP